MPYDIPDLGPVDPNQFQDPDTWSGYGADPNAWDPTQWQPPDASGDGVPAETSGNMPTPGQTTTAGQILQKLFAGGNQRGQNAADLASMMSKFGLGEKADRLDRANLTQKYDQNMLNAQSGRNQTESDALKKLAQTSYLSSGGSQFKPPVLTLDGKTYNMPDLGYGPKAASADQIAGANALKSQLVQRLSPGGTYTPQPLDSYAQPGTGEKIGNYGSAGLSGLGAIFNALGIGGGGNPSGAAGAQSAGGTGSGGSLGQGLGLASTGLGLAKGAGLLGNSTTAGSGAASGAAGAGAGMSAGQALARFGGPAIGAAAGIYGLSQNKGGMSNVMNGAGTGASIGTMILPGIGTGIGAGLGAAYGGLQNLFTTTQKEKDGRTVEGNFEKSLGGFDGMMGAVGQGYASTGHSSQEAQTDVKTMLDAEKHGPQATQAALQIILTKMGKR